MYPLVGKVNLHAVDVVDLFVLEHLLHLVQYSINIGSWCEVDAVLCDEIVRIFLTQLAHLLALVCQIGQEQGYAHQGVASIVTLRIDDSAIALTADDGTYLLHLRGDVDLAYCRSAIFTAMTLCDITQCTRRREV